MMTQESVLDFFLGKLGKQTSQASSRIFLARRTPMFRALQIQNKWRFIGMLGGCRNYRFSNGREVVDLPLAAGDILLVEPLAGISCNDERAYDMLSVVCNPSELRFVAKECRRGGRGIQGPDAVLHCGRTEVKSVRLLLETLADVVKREPCPDVSSLLAFLFSEYGRALLEKGAGKQSRSQYLLERIVAHIGENLLEDLNCSRVAAEFGISKNYVAQLFSRGMPCGFSAYVCRQRLELARQLLENSTMNIGEIADYCGFRQANYFIRRFREQYGRTPLAYRSGG